MNNGNYISIVQLQQEFKNKNIPIGIALDFNGPEILCDKNGHHEQFNQITQQMAKVENINKYNIQKQLAGQSEWLLPVYILNDIYVRSQKRIIHVEDLYMNWSAIEVRDILQFVRLLLYLIYNQKNNDIFTQKR